MVVERAVADEDYSEWMTVPDWRNVGSKTTVDRLDVSTGWGADGDWKIYVPEIKTR